MHETKSHQPQQIPTSSATRHTKEHVETIIRPPTKGSQSCRDTIPLFPPEFKNHSACSWNAASPRHCSMQREPEPNSSPRVPSLMLGQGGLPRNQENTVAPKLGPSDRTATSQPWIKSASPCTDSRDDPRFLAHREACSTGEMPHQRNFRRLLRALHA